MLRNSNYRLWTNRCRKSSLSACKKMNNWKHKFPNSKVISSMALMNLRTFRKRSTRQRKRRQSWRKRRKKRRKGLRNSKAPSALSKLMLRRSLRRRKRLWWLCKMKSRSSKTNKVTSLNWRLSLKKLVKLSRRTMKQLSSWTTPSQKPRSFLSAHFSQASRTNTLRINLQLRLHMSNDRLLIRMLALCLDKNHPTRSEQVAILHLGLLQNKTSIPVSTSTPIRSATSRNRFITNHPTSRLRWENTGRIQ